MVLGNWISTCERMKRDPYFTQYPNINLKWIKDLKYNTWNHKKHWRKIGEKLLDIGLSNDLFGSDMKSTGNKSKNKQVGLPQTKTLRYSRANSQQNKKAIHGMRGNIS